MDEDDEPPGPYATLGRDAIQTLIQNAEPPEARRLCQINRYTRQTCNQQLSIPEKARICLKDGEAAKECDKIPMITERQFKLLIPRNIEVFAEDPLQLRRDFYPQRYKLASEGFTEALYKAKLMNTICALLRPDINLEYAALMPQLPVYVDAAIIRLNQQLFQAAMKSPNVRHVMIGIYDEILPKYTTENRLGQINMSFRPSNGLLKVDRFLMFIESKNAGLMQNLVNSFNEPFLKMYIHLLSLRPSHDFYRAKLLIDAPRSGDEYEIPNTFRISRMLKVIFDLGICKVAKLIVGNAGNPPDSEIEVVL